MIGARFPATRDRNCRFCAQAENPISPMTGGPLYAGLLPGRTTDSSQPRGFFIRADSEEVVHAGEPGRRAVLVAKANTLHGGCSSASVPSAVQHIPLSAGTPADRLDSADVLILSLRHRLQHHLQDLPWFQFSLPLTPAFAARRPIFLCTKVGLFSSDPKLRFSSRFGETAAPATMGLHPK
jgi:hypothetical protein